MKNISSQTMVAIIGPTAVGKTDLVLNLARQLGAEVVNMDSMQVYRCMDIGTAKPTIEEMEKIRHHLIDIVDPDEEYNVNRFISDADQACHDISARGLLPVLTGGTGLYLKGFEEGVFEAFPGEEKSGIREKLQEILREKGRDHLFASLERVDPVSAARVHPNDTYRLLRALEIYEETGIPWSTHLTRQQEKGASGGRQRSILKIGLTIDRDALYERIDRRTLTMFDLGLPEEVWGLIERGYGRDLKTMQSIGYRHAARYLAGEWSRAEAIRIMARDTRHYAKRQYTWFNRDRDIKWFDPSRQEEIAQVIKKFIRKEQQ
jgi:tRNA dimethylallyltransferase